MDPKFMLETILDLSKHVKAILEDNLENNARHQRNDMRTLALLKAIAGELVYADPTAKARMHNQLDHLLLLHGDDENFCNGIKEAVKVISAA